MAKSWFEFKAKANKPDTVEVSIYDDIGAYGVSAKQFISELNQHKGKNVQVNINTPGGDMFAGLAMYNALRAHGSRITTKTMGIAASAGSVVFEAGDHRVMPENTFVMVHNPWIFTAGNAEELRDMADTLDYLGESLVKTYAARTGLSDDDVREMLAEDTYMSAEDAVAQGFADEIVPALAVTASFDVERLPENVRAVFAQAGAPPADKPPADEPPADEPPADEPPADEPPADEPPADEPPADEPPADEPPQAAFADQVLALTTAAGLPEFGAVLALQADTIDAVKSRISAAREIKALCALAGTPEAAGKYISKALSVADVKSALLDTLAEHDAALNTSNIRPAGSDTPSAGAAVWAKIFPNRQTKE